MSEPVWTEPTCHVSIKAFAVAKSLRRFVMADVEANRAAQRTIYGEPLGVVVDRCRGVLGLTQTRVAELLGISAPMLSQLITAHRVKIGNPAAVQRLRVMVEACDAVSSGRANVDDAIERIRAAGGAGDILTGSSQRIGAQQAAEQVQASFRRAAGAAEYVLVAGKIEQDHPAIARLLRVYGAGRADEAAALLRR